MNFKNLIKLSSLLFVMIAMLSGATFAQTTYYVNSVTGLDGYDGLHSTVTGTPGQGPKKTISNAITAASSGDIISVEAVAAYDEVLTVTDKKLSFRATGGTVEVKGASASTIDIDAAVIASPNDNVTFEGPYKFSNGIVLTDGDIKVANNLTVGTTFTRTFGTSVDAQLNYAGTVAFVYDGTGMVATDVLTTGFELPPTASAATIGNFTTQTFAAGAKLLLNEGKTINGAITSAGIIDLNGYTFNLVKTTNTTHTFSANVINGTINVVTGDNAGQTVTITDGVATVNIPNLTVTTGHANANAVSVVTGGTVGNVSVSGTNQAVTLNGPVTVGNVLNSSTGTLTLTTPTTIGSISNTSTGDIAVSAAAATNAISNSGSQVINAAGVQTGNTGEINFALAATVTGDVTLSGNGQINFGAAATITGNVYNNVAFNLAYAATAAATWQNLGVISFAGAATVTGEVKNQASFAGSISIDNGGAVAALFQNNGEIRFNGALNGVSVTGTITNATSAASLALTRSGAGNPTNTFQNNGRITFAANAAGSTLPAIVNSANYLNIASTGGITYGNNGGIVFASNPSAVTVASVTNSSLSEVASNGIIDFGAGAGSTTVTGDVISSGGKGGDILFPASSFSVRNLSNQRTEADADIQVGAGATALATVTVTGDLVNTGKSKILLNVSSTGNVSVAGKLENSGTGSIELPNITTGSIGINSSFDVSNGTVALDGAGAATGAITVKNANLTGGTIKLGTGVRSFTANGTGIILGDADSSPTFNNGGSTTLTLSAPVPTNYQTLSIGALGVIYPGILDINNNSGLVDAVTIAGGNLRVLGNVSFTNGSVAITGTNQRLFIGSEVAPVGAGNFTNAAGYRTENNAFISLNGNAASTVSGAGTFQNFEVDMAAGATINAAGAFTTVFNLTKGVVTVTSVIFNNAASYPTIVRNAGSFNVAPTFTSMVNVYYIGIDKSTGNELPAAANKLNNLTVATTNGVSAPGKGTVQTTVATTVNGTLTVNANQALLISGVDLTINGASVVVNGDIASVNATDELVLNRVAGTAVTGSGWLPAVRIAVGSLGNTIVGPKGLVTGLLGADGWRGGAGANADFDATTASANADVTFAAGNAALSVSFGAGALNGSNLRNIVTAHSGNALTIASNMVQAGDITHAAGTITVPENVVWTYRGAAPALTGGATPAAIAGAGKLLFLQTTGAAVPVTLTVGTGAGSLAISNLEINLGAAADAFTVNTNALTISGVINIARGTLTMAQNVTVTGNALTVSANGAIAGPGVLTLQAAVEPLTFTYTGTPTITNLTIKKGVVLAGTGTSLTVTGAFIHDAGELNFADRTLTISGTFTRTSGVYNATTGYLVISGATFAKGTANFSIPNLRFTNAATAVTGNAVVTVTSKLDLNVAGTLDITPAGTTPATVAVANNATVKYQAGTFDLAPVYAGSITLEAENTATGVIPAEVWPETPANLVTNLVVNSAGNNVRLAGDRTVASIVNLKAGTLDLTTGSRKLTVTNPIVRRTQAGAVTVAPNGTLTYSAAPTVIYEPSLASAGGDFTVGEELPATVASLTFTRSANVANAVVTVNKAVTVSGVLNILNDINATSAISTSDTVKIAKDSYANAVIPTTTFGAPLSFTGDKDQVLIVPGNGVNFGAISINKTNNNNTVTLEGGNVVMGGNITFVKGLFVTGDNSITLVNTSGTSNLGFVRNVAVGNLSHIVGNVVATLKAGTVPAFGRTEFPVGDATNYRPAAITALNPTANVSLGVNVTVNEVSEAPTGNVGLPIGDVTSYPDFYWFISSNISLGNTIFDLELKAGGYTPDDVSALRIIRRIGTAEDTENQWLLQGQTYDNFIAGGIPTVVNTNSQGGIRPEGGIFTYGIAGGDILNVVSGTVKYDNAAATAMNGVTVTLTDGTQTFTATTNASGAFTIADVPNGSYNLTAVKAGWLGANATDALLVAKHYAGTATLAGLKLTAADVNNSGTVNNTDALLVLKRSTVATTVFAKGDWVSSPSSVVVNNAAVVVDVKALATGDVNGSNTPSLAKAAPTVTVTTENAKLNKTNVINVPVKVASDLNVGAMTLVFSYPADLVSFEGIATKANNVERYDDQKGKIALAWADITGKEAIDLKAGEAIVTLQFKSKQELKAGSVVNVELDGAASEIANKLGEVVNASLNIASMEIAKPTAFALRNNYPNPFNPATTIRYEIPVNGVVNLVVFNSLGEQVATLVNGAQEVGQYEVNFNASNLTSGVYFYRITVNAGEQNFTQTHKMILMK